MQHHRLPNGQAALAVNLEEVLDITTRLNALIVQECLLLASMQVRELHTVQDEKMMLSERLQLLQRAIAADDQMVATAAPDTRNQLLHAANELTVNIEENLRLTALAQSANRMVMQTFVEVLAEQQRVTVYSPQGQQDSGAGVTVSLNINERA